MLEERCTSQGSTTLGNTTRKRTMAVYKPNSSRPCGYVKFFHEDKIRRGSCAAPQPLGNGRRGDQAAGLLVVLAKESMRGGISGGHFTSRTSSKGSSRQEDIFQCRQNHFWTHGLVGCWWRCHVSTSRKSGGVSYRTINMCDTRDCSYINDISE